MSYGVVLEANTMNEQESSTSGLEKNITDDEAQKITGLCRQTLFRKRKRGELHYYQIGKRVLYSPSHIKEFLSRFEE